MKKSIFFTLLITILSFGAWLPMFAQEEEDDVYPVSATLIGTEASEKLQGFESDDTITGGGGADLFPLTLGNDVITDFDPNEDMIDVGDFARPTDDFEVLTSLEAIASNATETLIDGILSLVIDVDGDKGNSTTTLIGVILADLNENNVFFGLDGTSIPPLDFTHIAESVVVMSNGDVITTPGHVFGEDAESSDEDSEEDEES